MSKKKYSLVFIDADDTLYDFQQCEHNALVKTFLENNIEPSDTHIARYHHFNDRLWKDLENGLLKQDAIKHERFRLLVEFYDFGIDYLHLSNEYIRNLSQERILLPDAEEVCRYLHGKYTIILLTNGISEIQRGRFEKSSLRKYFSKLIISDEACCSKPDPGIFEWALKDTGFTNKQEMIIIGDSLSSDIQGGRNFGIDTCWLNSSEASSGTISPDYIIGSLIELKRIL